jgi:hypothetical protein
MHENEYPMLPVCRPKTGREKIITHGKKQELTLEDYWRWAHSELNSNAERGKFAEFLVSVALGCEGKTSQEWDAYDLDWEAEGLKIEVKTSAYIQTWAQNRPSYIQYGIQQTHGWNAIDNKDEEEVRRQADVYVFCLETCKNQSDVNPLDLSQWIFYVLPTLILDEKVGSQKTISLGSLKEIGAVEIASFDALAEGVRDAMEKVGWYRDRECFPSV